MPELPEVQTVASELNRKLKNKTIKAVRVLRPKMVAVGPAVLPPKRQAAGSKVIKFIKSLRGQKVKSVNRRAKLLVFDFTPTPSTSPNPSLVRRGMEEAGGERIKLLVHLKMTGQFIYLKKSELNKKIKIINSADSPDYAMPCPYTHVIFFFTDGSKLFYNDLRQFGYLKLVRDDELARVTDLQDFGPEPLSPGFTYQIFKGILKKRPNAKIKQLLTDQNLIAGIGNIYSDEILFHAHVRPARTIKSLSKYEFKYIFKYIPIVLKKAIAAHGSSVGDFIRTDGSWGTMGKYHFVYGRGGQKCKVCGMVIKTTRFNGRTGSFCPKCQK